MKIPLLLSLLLVLLAIPSRADTLIAPTVFGDVDYFPDSGGYGGFTGGFVVGNNNAYFHAYASFDTSSLSPVTVASVAITTSASTYTTPSTLSIYLVPATTILTRDATSYDALTSGTVIGSVAINSTPSGTSTLNVPLNLNGIAALNEAISSSSAFFLGFAIPFSGTDPANLFFYADGSYPELDVPEPSTWALGLFALAIAAYRKRVLVLRRKVASR